MSRPSKRFDISAWTEYIVPALLVLLVIGLLATILVVALALAGAF